MPLRVVLQRHHRPVTVPTELARTASRSAMTAIDKKVMADGGRSFSFCGMVLCQKRPLERDIKCGKCRNLCPIKECLLILRQYRPGHTGKTGGRAALKSPLCDNATFRTPSRRYPLDTCSAVYVCPPVLSKVFLHLRTSGTTPNPPSIDEFGRPSGDEPKPTFALVGHARVAYGI
jgi:hypothetical protein